MELFGKDEVRIVELAPVTVAVFHVNGSSTPEQDSWMLLQAALPEISIKNFQQRYFGFNNPNPTPGKLEYGYEQWLTLPPGFETNSALTLKQFDGGKYAVVSARISNIFERWQALGEWVKRHGYRYSCQHQCLEELLNPSEYGTDSMQLDLFCPIE